MANDFPQPSLYRFYEWHHFKKNILAFSALIVLGFLVITALLAPLLANERPLCMKYHGQYFFPAFSLQNNYQLKNNDGTVEKIQLDITDWKKFPAEKIIYAPVAYSPGKSDYYNSGFISPSGEQKFSGENGKPVAMPLRFRHWLGTDQLGADLLSGLIHGSRISLTIGLMSMTIASLIGIFLGAFAGFFGDNKLTTTRGRFYTTLFGLLFAWFYGFRVRGDALASGLKNSPSAFIMQLMFSVFIFLSVTYIFSLVGKITGKLPWLKKKMKIPADTLISRLIEVIVSLPIFVLIIAIAAISKPSITNLMIIIGLTSWTGIARLTRAEMLRIRNEEFILSAQALGYPLRRIIFRHALPNAIAPALISNSFGIANAILIESALSFIGLGPSDTTTWGSLLSEGRSNFDAWWMVLFPGLCIFITITAYNLVGEALRDALDPKMKR